MRPYDVNTEDQLIAMTSDNHPQDAERWSILNFSDKVSLHPPADSDWVGWVEIPRDQFNAIVDWYMKEQSTPSPAPNMMGGGIAASIKQAVGECLAGMLYSEVSKDARRKIEKAIDLAIVPKPAWMDMASAPKDGTMLRLLVLPDQEEFTAFDDSLTPYETIGSNNLADTGEDRWQFAGWDWQQDCFITGRGEVIGWAPFKAAEMSQIEAAVRWCLDRDQRNGSLPEAYAERLRAALAASPAPQTREPGISPLPPFKAKEE